MAIETPFLAVDGIINLFDAAGFYQGIVLIERKNPPHGWAIPGGFVDVGETCEQALVREMKEETNLDVEITGLLGIYSDPSRDSRFHTASAVYVCKASGVPEAQDDAKNLKIVSLESVPYDTLVFDHATIIRDYLLR